MRIIVCSIVATLILCSGLTVSEAEAGGDWREYARNRYHYGHNGGYYRHDRDTSWQIHVGGAVRTRIGHTPVTVGGGITIGDDYGYGHSYPRYSTCGRCGHRYSYGHRHNCGGYGYGPGQPVYRWGGQVYTTHGVRYGIHYRRWGAPRYAPVATQPQPVQQVVVVQQPQPQVVTQKVITSPPPKPTRHYSFE